MLKTLKERTKGMTFFSPDKSQTINISAMMYVDDNTPGVNDMDVASGMPLAQLFTTANVSAQTWERILFASGGSLELTKCFTTVVAWNWTDGVPTIVHPDDFTSRISLY
jgi:hypothetical protein